VVIIVIVVHWCSDASCRYAFQVNSRCYKVHKNEHVSWYTAVHRCLSYNASLAVFDDDPHFLQYVPSIVLADNAWVGLVKSWWMWPDFSKFLMYRLDVLHVIAIKCKTTYDL